MHIPSTSAVWILLFVVPPPSVRTVARKEHYSYTRSSYSKLSALAPISDQCRELVAVFDTLLGMNPSRCYRASTCRKDPTRHSGRPLSRVETPETLWRPQMGWLAGSAFAAAGAAFSSSGRVPVPGCSVCLFRQRAARDKTLTGSKYRYSFVACSHVWI